MASKHQNRYAWYVSVNCQRTGCKTTPCFQKRAAALTGKNLAALVGTQQPFRYVVKCALLAFALGTSSRLRCFLHPQIGVPMANEPGFYLSLTRQHPDYIAAVEALGEAIRASGPLDSRTLHLVQLAAAAAIRSEGAVHSHVRRAVEEGVRPEELRHALISLTSTIGFPNVTAALSWCDDVLNAAKRK